MSRDFTAFCCNEIAEIVAINSICTVVAATTVTEVINHNAPTRSQDASFELASFVFRAKVSEKAPRVESSSENREPVLG